ncbi:glycosyltransferase [bacterium]|nr:glycosyltransferase [bacterium]
MQILNKAKVNEADLIVAIPSFNEAENISFVTSQIDMGLATYFPQKKNVIVNVDNNSTDATKQVFLETKTKFPKVYITTKAGEKGKGYNFYNLFLFFKKMEAKSGLVLDADLKSIHPNWIAKMALPVFDGFDYVLPFYTRFEDDATITNHFVFPLLYGLFGFNVRQPIGGDFAFSNKMVDLWLKKKWGKADYGYGIDIFMTLGAFFSDAKICQANLGTKVHNHSLPKLSSMFIEVADSLFKIIAEHKDLILNKVTLKEVKILDGDDEIFLADIKPEWKIFSQLFENINKFDKKRVRELLDKKTFEKILSFYKSKAAQPEIDLDLWTRIVYDSLYSYLAGFDKDFIIRMLECFYFGRVASFFKETENFSPRKSEKAILKQGEYFLKHRNYFLSKINKL